MALRLYFDEDSQHAAVLRPLAARGIHTVTALSAGLAKASDEEHLSHAVAGGMVLVSQNIQDFYRLHGEWLAAGRHHPGMILIAQERLSIGERIRRIQRLCAERTPEQMRDQAEFLSAWG